MLSADKGKTHGWSPRRTLAEEAHMAPLSLILSLNALTADAGNRRLKTARAPCMLVSNTTQRPCLKSSVVVLCWPKSRRPSLEDAEWRLSLPASTFERHQWLEHAQLHTDSAAPAVVRAGARRCSRIRRHARTSRSPRRGAQACADDHVSTLYLSRTATDAGAAARAAAACGAGVQLEEGTLGNGDCARASRGRKETRERREEVGSEYVWLAGNCMDTGGLECEEEKLNRITATRARQVTPDSGACGGNRGIAVRFGLRQHKLNGHVTADRSYKRGCTRRQKGNFVEFSLESCPRATTLATHHGCVRACCRGGVCARAPL
eukprot:3701456-Pleurochrysis_carterae.AAC.1